MLPRHFTSTVPKQRSIKAIHSRNPELTRLTTANKVFILSHRHRYIIPSADPSGLRTLRLLEHTMTSPPAVCVGTIHKHSLRNRLTCVFLCSGNLLYHARRQLTNLSVHSSTVVFLWGAVYSHTISSHTRIQTWAQGQPPQRRYCNLASESPASQSPRPNAHCLIRTLYNTKLMSEFV